MDQSPQQRLNKYLALQLGISRREADDLIGNGSVTIAGRTASLGARYDSTEEIKVNGKAVTSHETLRYVMYHKPAGTVCSRRRQGDAPTIYEQLPPNLRTLKAVGRLDKDSSGLLLLTNDGDFAYQMTHPKFYKTKVYEVQLDHDLEPLHQQMISDYGVHLDDGVSKFIVTKKEPATTSPITYEITMHEGRNRQIRRTFAALGYTVIHLHRIQFGNYSLDNLGPGHYQSIQ